MKKNIIRHQGGVLKPLKGRVLNFSKMVACLQRPYIEITKEVYEEILNNTKENYFLYKNKVVTFGTRDGGQYYLMPLNESKSQEIIEYNRKLKNKNQEILEEENKKINNYLSYDNSMSL